MWSESLRCRTQGSWVQSPPLPILIWMSIVPACDHVSLLRGAGWRPQPTSHTALAILHIYSEQLIATLKWLTNYTLYKYPQNPNRSASLLASSIAVCVVFVFCICLFSVPNNGWSLPIGALVSSNTPTRTNGESSEQCHSCRSPPRRLVFGELCSIGLCGIWSYIAHGHNQGAVPTIQHLQDLREYTL